MTEALQFAGVGEVQHLHPCITSPSYLFEALQDSDRMVVDTVPFKQNQLFMMGVLR